MSENSDLEANDVLPVIVASLATFFTVLSVWPNEPDWSSAAIMACAATGYWSTVILERAKRRAQKTDSNEAALDPNFLFRFEAIFALAYTMLTIVWAFVVGFLWIALAVVPALYWYRTFKYWQNTKSPSQLND